MRKENVWKMQLGSVWKKGVGTTRKCIRKGCKWRLGLAVMETTPTLTSVTCGQKNW